MVNLADLGRARGMNQQGAEMLRKAISVNANVKHSPGLLLVRQRDYPGALDLLRQTHELMPENTRYAYVYAVALNSTGSRDDAISLLERTHHRHPPDKDVLLALNSIARDKGDVANALLHAREFVTLYPSDAQFRGPAVGSRIAPSPLEAQRS